MNPADSLSQVPTRITVTPSHLNLKVGDTAEPEVSVRDQDNTRITNPVLSWSISAPQVVSVNSRGVITALSEGGAVVTVMSGSASAVIRVSVRPVSEDEAALAAFYEAMDGSRWSNNDNWLSARPVGDWYGVTADSEGSVRELVLDRNGLNGVLPPELGVLDELQRLVLRDIAIKGEIPGELGRLERLHTLVIFESTITGPIPPSLGNLRNLTGLYLNDNQLTGEIPSSLGNLSQSGIPETVWEQAEWGNPPIHGEPGQTQMVAVESQSTQWCDTGVAGRTFPAYETESVKQWIIGKHPGGAG